MIPTWSSKHALEVAARLFRAAKFTVLHAWDVPFKGFISDQHTHTQHAKEQEGHMTTFVKTVSFGFADRSSEFACEITPILRQGSPANVVHTHVKETEPDLVVRGSHW